MPFFTPDKNRALPQLGYRQVDEVAVEDEKHDDSPAFFSEVVPAAFRLDNPIVSLYQGTGRISTKLSQERDPDFDPFNSIEGYEEYAFRFVDADSQEEVNWIKSKIDQHLKCR